MQARLIAFVTLAALFSGSLAAPTVFNDAQVTDLAFSKRAELHHHPKEHRVEQHHKRDMGHGGRGQNEGRQGFEQNQGPHGFDQSYGPGFPQEQRLDNHHHKREMGHGGGAQNGGGRGQNGGRPGFEQNQGPNGFEENYGPDFPQEQRLDNQHHK
eukprot:GHVU01166749.1.p1 GENE.GHVU01166749.1~~GHVU01166749.1.p1  ORF type:complete len:155 (-),score=21.78 GHVU01166749.1:100-564(-)